LGGTAGSAGIVVDVAATSIAHIVSADTNLTSVTNPMAAAGGVDPETPLAIRRDAPQAYLVQERAVTEPDYADMALRTPGVAHAVATQRWTGSWYTVYVTADRDGGAAVDDDFAAAVVDDLDVYRMAGYDVDVNGPTLVALKIELFICVLPPYLRADVHQALLMRLGSQVGPNGVRGLFHPDNFTFGQPVYLSAVVAAAQEVPGVQSVTVTTFARAVDDPGTGLITGELPMGRTELAQCANDPNFPDHGVLTITMGGGR
jgi:predicted phage baseplate assembly protein